MEQETPAVLPKGRGEHKFARRFPCAFITEGQAAWLGTRQQVDRLSREQIDRMLQHRGRIFPLRANESGEATIPMWVMAVEGLSPGAKLLYGALTLVAAGKKFCGGESVPVLAEICGCSDRTVQNHLQELTDHGLVARLPAYEDHDCATYLFFDHGKRYREGVIPPGRQSKPPPAFTRYMVTRKEFLTEMRERVAERQAGGR